MRISDWSSDVCSSDLARDQTGKASTQPAAGQGASSSAAVDMAQSDARRLQLDPKRDQNYQGRKLDFLNQKIARDVYTPHPLQDPVSPFQVLAGPVIPASVVTGTHSHLPGLGLPQVHGTPHEH